MFIYSIIRKFLFPVFRLPIKKISGVTNLPFRGGYLIAANHNDFLDGFFITAAAVMRRPRQVKFLSETKNYWWTGGATIPVDKKNKAKSLEIALKFLNNGKIICLFPEGRRNNLDIIPKAKTGLARLALWSKKPVIPLGIICASGRTFFDSLKLFVLKKKPLEIKIGQPMTFPDLYDKKITRDLLEEVSGRIMKEVAVLCNKKYPY
jgi:1-acyl-sn-glycerol-3-phosphate acyltransferase